MVLVKKPLAWHNVLLALDTVFALVSFLLFKLKLLLILPEISARMSSIITLHS